MFFLACCLVGFVSLSRLRVSLFPELTFPRVTVLTGYPNAAPEEIENLVTRPLEEALAAVNGVRRVSSVSYEGLSVITVDLEWGHALESAQINIRQKLDVARPMLPQQAGHSILLRHDPADEPVLVLAARPIRLSFSETRDFLEASIRPHLERLPGVAAVSVRGGFRREIQLAPSTGTLRSVGLSLSELGSIVGAASYSFPVGHVRDGSRELSVRYEGDFASLSDIGAVLLRAGSSGQPLSLGAVTRVLDGWKDRTGSALVNGRPAVVVTLRKEPGRNTVETAARARAALIDINHRFARELRLEVLQDNSVLVSDSVASVVKAAVAGVAIAFLVLLFFLRDLWTAIVIAISVPTAVLFTFASMFALGVSLNVMSLGGLSLGIGMLVDNAIVVMESIAQERERNEGGLNLTEDCISGARHVGGSVVAATLTSIVVFLPIIFVSGLAGAIFRDLALTVTASLFASLVTALTLVPMLAAHRPAAGGRFSRWSGRLERRLAPWFERVDRIVSLVRTSFLRWTGRALLHPRRVALTALVLSLAAAALLLLLPRSLFPKVDSGIVTLDLELAPGADIVDSETLLATLGQTVQRDVRHSVSFIGHDPDDLNSLISGVRDGGASRTVFYLHRERLSAPTFAGRLRHALAGLNVRARIAVRGDVLEDVVGESGASVRVEAESVKRTDARAAIALVQGRIRRRVGAEGGVPAMNAPGLTERPESRYYPIRDAIAAAGLSPEQVAHELHSAVDGAVVAMLRSGDHRFPIRLRLPAPERNRARLLGTLGIRTAQGDLLSLDSLLSSKSGTGPVLLRRRDQKRVEELTVEAGERHGGIVSAVVEQVVAESRSSIPPTVNMRVATANAEALASLGSLGFAFLLSAVLIYQLLAGQFESLVHPVSLSAAVPLMLVGVAPALFLTGHGLNISSVIGLILAAGLVVNAGIVLYERIEQERARNAEADLQDVVLSAVALRIRPILLTTLTTVLGMLPLAIGSSGSGSLQGAMAVTVISALLVGTSLALVVFPAVFVAGELWLEQRRCARLSQATGPKVSVPDTAPGSARI